MEYTMLQGLVISIQKFSEQEFFDYVKTFVPRINNWAVCDTFCSSIKFTKKVLPKMRNFLDFYLTSKEEYNIRFGVVMLLNYYVIDEYIDDTLQALVKIKTEDYYAQMAIAWALSICYIKYFEKTHMIVSKSKIDSKILNMTIRKVNESLRPTKDQMPPRRPCPDVRRGIWRTYFCRSLRADH